MIKGAFCIFIVGMLALGLHYTGFIRLFSENKDLASNNDSSSWNPSPPPQITIKDLKGKDFSLESLKGKPVILNFWASWCPPCRKEFPELISTVERFKGNVTLLAISNDSSKKDMEGFLDNLKREGLNLHNKNIYILWDSELEVSKKFNVAKWPETFILDQNLQIVKKQAGVFSLEEIEPFIFELISNKTLQ
ncbi:MAG: TlpA disulfide reductase family protein [Bdellovibrionales bacterium]|nr:TlpA disulfide reductase family protein [Bdellovibrionales bacterium]